MWYSRFTRIRDTLSAKEREVLPRAIVRVKRYTLGRPNRTRECGSPDKHEEAVTIVPRKDRDL
jgi:hypothetical protein